MSLTLNNHKSITLQNNLLHSNLRRLYKNNLLYSKYSKFTFLLSLKVRLSFLLPSITTPVIPLSGHEPIITYSPAGKYSFVRTHSKSDSDIASIARTCEKRIGEGFPDIIT